MTHAQERRAASVGNRALEDVLVLDLTDESAAYAPRILADLGADVIRIEDAAGDSMRDVPPFDETSGQSHFHRYMNVNKELLTLDLQGERDRRRLDRLFQKAQIVFETFGSGGREKLGIDCESLRAANPELVWTCVTPFGDSGPRASWRADDLVSQAMGGLMRLSGSPEREPLCLFGNQTTYISGLHAASASLIGLLHAEASGKGQFIDVSIQDCVAHTLENAIQFYSAEGKVREREAGSNEAGVGLFRCSDGLVYVYASAWMLRDSWLALVNWMEEEGIEAAQSYRDEHWMDVDYRRTEQPREQIKASIEALFASRSKKQVYKECQRRRILAAPLNTVPDLLANPQLVFFDWFRPVAFDSMRTALLPGPPVRLSETPAALRLAATDEGVSEGRLVEKYLDDRAPEQEPMKRRSGSGQ